MVPTLAGQDGEQSHEKLCLFDMYTIGIAGTAKNTGKTTTLQALIEESSRDPRLIVGISSIGYDGEWVDNITGLPKPRVHVHEGMMVATAEKCIPIGSCRMRVLEITDMSTPLGKIIIGQIIQEGLLLIAGPNKETDVTHMLKLMSKHGCDILFLDGALNRIMPFGQSDAVIIASGASRSQKIDQLTNELRQIEQIINYPYILLAAPKETETKITIDGEHTIDNGSLLSHETLEMLKSNLKPNHKTLWIPGAIRPDCLFTLIEYLILETCVSCIAIPHCMKLLPSGQWDLVIHGMKLWAKNRRAFAVVKRNPLVAVTVNPFFPSYRSRNNQYAISFVDRDELLTKAKEHLHVPVYDIHFEGASKLWEAIEKQRGNSIDERKDSKNH